MRASPAEIDPRLTEIPGASAACWSPEDVAARLFRAGEVLKAREACVLPAGYRTAWPDLGPDPHVNFAPEQARYRIQYGPKDQDAADEAIEWVLALPVEADGVPLRSIVAARMFRMPFSKIGRRYGISRYLATRQWRDGLSRIAGALNRG